MWMKNLAQWFWLQVIKKIPLIAESELTEMGFEVKTALSGKQALDLFEQHSFGLVITDCEMPEMDGFELTEKLLKLSIISCYWLYCRERRKAQSMSRSRYERRAL